MTINIMQNFQRIKITYRDKKRVWFCEQTKKDLLTYGISWRQWGQCNEILRTSVLTSETIINNWINQFNLMG